MLETRRCKSFSNESAILSSRVYQRGVVVEKKKDLWLVGPSLFPFKPWLPLIGEWNQSYSFSPASLAELWCSSESKSDEYENDVVFMFSRNLERTYIDLFS